MPKLKGKTCIVTGAARGIGSAICDAFHSEGAAVIVTDIDLAAAKAFAATLGCDAEQLDVRREDDWDRLATCYPRADVVVNNAGITGFEEGGRPHDPEQCSLEDWHAVHRVNLDGTFLGCRYAIRAMKRSGSGSIINISSRSGLVGVPKKSPPWPSYSRRTTHPSSPAPSFRSMAGCWRDRPRRRDRISFAQPSARSPPSRRRVPGSAARPRSCGGCGCRWRSFAPSDRRFAR